MVTARVFSEEEQRRSSSGSSRRGASGLPRLPVELLEGVCQSLDLRDRIALMSCCYDLWACPEVAASAQLWGSLEARFGATPRRTAAEPSIIYVLSDDELEVEPEEEDSDSEPEPLFSRGGAALQQWSLGGWLTRRKLGVRRLHLRFGRCTSVALPALLGALEGSRLEDLRISFPPGGPSSRQRGSGSSGRGSPSSTSSTRSRGRRVGHSPTPAHWDLVRHLVCLTRLELPWCGLTSLPAGLSALTGLCELDVSFNAALGRASAGALRPLRHLSQLTRLDLSECKLPQRLPLLPELRELHLRSACLRGREGPSLTLDHHSRLTYLCLNNCGLAQLPPGLSALGGTLAELDLNWNTDLLEAEAGGGGTMSLLGHLSALTCLELARCSLRRVPPSLASLTSLARLNLNGNGALGSGGGSSAAFEPLRSLAGSLTSLQMYECGLQRVPAQLAGLSRLAQLSLASNDMLGCQDDGGPVFAALQSLAALTWLSLSWCSLPCLPAAISSLLTLRHLDAAHNEVGDYYDAVQPARTLRELEVLDLRGCGLHPSAPMLSGLGPKCSVLCQGKYALDPSLS